MNEVLMRDQEFPLFVLPIGLQQHASSPKISSLALPHKMIILPRSISCVRHCLSDILLIFRFFHPRKRALTPIENIGLFRCLLCSINYIIDLLHIGIVLLHLF